MNIETFLDSLEAPAPSPCGGTAAAVSAAMAAALVTMVARGSRSWPEGPAIATKAQALRATLTALGDDDAAAFARVLVARRKQTGTCEEREAATAASLVAAAEVPLQIGEAAADVAELAAIAASEGARHLRPDAAAAATMAEAAVRAATHLVEINLAVVRDDLHSATVARLLAAAASARERAST